MPSARTVLFGICLLALIVQTIRFGVFHLWKDVDSGDGRLADWEHPIPRLMSEAEAKFRKLIFKQSKTLQQAVAEYRKRYKRDPPKGFDEWFAFAKKNDVKIIDEYDAMIEELAPFWALPGEEIRRRTLQVGQLPSIDLVRLENGKTTTLNINKGFTDTEVSARAKGFRVMIQKFQSKLPDMDFPINAKAEGRILIPWEHRVYPNMSKLDSSGGLDDMVGEDFTADWRGDGNVWEDFRRTCPPGSPARRLLSSMRGQATLPPNQKPFNYLEARENTLDVEDFNFVEKTDEDYDFCKHPWARYQQGHFFSDWRTIPVLYPVFSPARAKGFADIVIPSHYYYSSTIKYTYGWDKKNQVIKDVDDAEVAWENKTDLIFWRGSTTGGGSSPPGFQKQYQRHRFLEMATVPTNATRSIVFADPPGSDNYILADVPVNDMNHELLDTAFVKAVGCGEFKGGCDALMAYYRFADSVPVGDHYQHKYLVDFDGMGYSARVMAFLTSDSAVLKATVYREFFTDWIQPWLHYIPISSSYKELYNIHSFFSGPSPSMLNAANITRSPEEQRAIQAQHDGDRRLRRIARAGRQWRRSISRKVDMEVYVYRLCIEWARLWSDDREAMTYSS